MSTLGKIEFVGDLRGTANRPASLRLRHDRGDVRPPADVLEFSQEAVGRAADKASAQADRVVRAGPLKKRSPERKSLANTRKLIRQTGCRKVRRLTRRCNREARFRCK